MFEVTTYISRGVTDIYIGAGTLNPVITPSGVYYIVYIDRGIDVVYRKSLDGLNWGSPVTVFTGTTSNLSIWYDRWSGISAGKIHCAYTETVTDDTKYRSIDTENSDTLSSETTIFAGASTANGGALSIVRARGGNLYCKTMIDAGAEGGFFRSTDVGANWSSRTDSEALATTDQWILMPGWAADNQDIMMFFWDASADEISRCLYDDSGNSWGETSIATTMVDVAATVTYPHFAAAVDITNSQNLLVAWSGVDTANADLRCWKVTESAITEVTNVVLNSTDDQGLCAIGIDTATEDWYVFYFGLSDGSQTWNGTVRGYYKKSTDDGSTWGSETPFGVDVGPTTFLWCCPRFSTHPFVVWGDSSPYIFGTVDAPSASSGRAIQINNPSLVA